MSNKKNRDHAMDILRRVGEEQDDSSINIGETAVALAAMALIAAHF